MSRLSLQFPGVTGAIHDDMKGLVIREKYTPADYAPIYAALKAHNPAFKLWTVVYSHSARARCPATLSSPPCTSTGIRSRRTGSGT